MIDLTPYDMSADQEKKKSAPPRYVRDCLEGDPTVTQCYFSVIYHLL